MLEIKVLFWVRQDFYTHPGGDSTQALSMLNALRGMSIDVEISQDINISLKKFTHVFYLASNANPRFVVLLP